MRSAARSRPRIEKAPVVDAAAWIAALSEYIGQNDEAFREFPDLFSPDDVAALTRSSRDAFARVQPLLQRRGGMGLIRRGHGDLHLGNIVLIDGKPVLFDAIEFDPLVASGDVLYDLAFLLMDLVERGLGKAANIVFNRYLGETAREDDFDALAALPLFLSMRAAHPRQGDGGEARKCESERQAGDREKRARLFRARRPSHGAAATRARRDRRIVGHRQIGAGARARAFAPARARRGRPALRRDAQADVRRRARPTSCRRRPTRRR